MRFLIIFYVAFMALLMPTLAFSDNDAEAQDVRAALQYSGWLALKRQIIDPQAKEDEWLSMRDISMSDDGKKLRIKDGDKNTPYELELIVITYTQTDTTVLKLALYEDGKDKAITYIWSEPETKRIGMNLRWMQVGLTKK